MSSNYECKKYRNKYLLMTVFFLMFLSGWIWFNWGEITKETAGILFICILFAMVLDCFAYNKIKSVYAEMENVSGIMTQIMEKGEKLPEEEYKEGTVGILYTNLYKMVGVLEESRKRELQEKIFLRDIISDISHQLKTPLSSLMVFVDLLLEEKVKDEQKQKVILSEAANQLNRMEWMVLSMLKLARIEAGAIQFEQREINLAALLMQAAEGVQFLLKEKGQEIIIDCETDISLVCDGEWLMEALINLLKNASDYSEKGKRIWVEVECTRVYTRIYIKDEGMGIAEKDIPHIFKRFYCTHREVNPNSVGIGLSLTKSIIEGMGGSIHVKSEEGQYTWFILTFVR